MHREKFDCVVGLRPNMMPRGRFISSHKKVALILKTVLLLLGN